MAAKTTLRKAPAATSAKQAATSAKAATSTKSATSVKQAAPATTSATTSAKAATTTARAPGRSNEILGLPLSTWASGLRRAKGADARSGKRGFVFVLGSREPKLVKRLINGHLNRWQTQSCLDSEAETQMFQGANGPVWIVRAVASSKPGLFTSPGLEKSSYARVRDLIGALVSQLAPYQPDKLIFEFHGLSLEEERGAVVGLELASYSFQENRGNPRKPRRRLPDLYIKEGQLNEVEIRRAADLAQAMNIARHLTNLSGAELNPRTYAEAVELMFAGSDTMTVEVWEGEKLRRENMNLLIAVGRAAEEGPRLVHLRYRPRNARAGARPIAIVGKGVTFDSGGLDIKPSSNMRNMRKDMGGSAAAVGIARWAERTELDLPLDIYLSLAENAVSGNSFRPGDVITARNGLMVEISNTDAEGRLVLADAIDVAVNQDEKPQALFDIATLTGAIKVGLGAEIAGLFSNNEELGQLLFDAGTSKGDPMWRMPLFQPYRSMLRSNFADCMNSSEGGFGGAITAALFLESFVRGVPWAHLDVYAWRDSAMGAWAEAGGSGQPVQALAEALTRIANESQAVELA